jgi:ATP-dependent Clp protease adaptor protein ClpS
MEERSAGVAIAEPAEDTDVRTAQQEKSEQKPKRLPRYHVVLWNDNDHSYPYVIRMLHQLFGHSIARGYKLADEVDKRGRAVILTTTKEHAELKRDQIHAFGKDDLCASCQGSMKSSIEPES